MARAGGAGTQSRVRRCATGRVGDTPGRNRRKQETLTIIIFSNLNVPSGTGAEGSATTGPTGPTPFWGVGPGWVLTLWPDAWVGPDVLTAPRGPCPERPGRTRGRPCG